jgi:hypothetical protein
LFIGLSARNFWLTQLRLIPFWFKKSSPLGCFFVSVISTDSI